MSHRGAIRGGPTYTGQCDFCFRRAVGVVVSHKHSWVRRLFRINRRRAHYCNRHLSRAVEFLRKHY